MPQLIVKQFKPPNLWRINELLLGVKGPSLSLLFFYLNSVNNGDEIGFNSFFLSRTSRSWRARKLHIKTDCCEQGSGSSNAGEQENFISRQTAASRAEEVPMLESEKLHIKTDCCWNNWLLPVLTIWSVCNFLSCYLCSSFTFMYYSVISENMKITGNNAVVNGEWIICVS